MPSRRLQLTLADVGLLIIGVASGFWCVRTTGILFETSLPTLTHSLLFLDYFVWGLSFVGPVVVVRHRISGAGAKTSASERTLFWLGAVNLAVIAWALVLPFSLYGPFYLFLFIRYHFGWIVLVTLSAFVLFKSACSFDWSWPEVFGLLVLVGHVRLTPAAMASALRRHAHQSESVTPGVSTFIGRDSSEHHSTPRRK